MQFLECNIIRCVFAGIFSGRLCIDNDSERVAAGGFNWWVSFAPEFQCCYFCESSCLFYLTFNFDFYVSKIMHL